MQVHHWLCMCKVGHVVICACLDGCMFYVLTFPFYLIPIQNLYQIVGLDETYKIEVMKFFF
jgi:hypothetical protein